MKKILFIMVLIFSILTTTQSIFAFFEEEKTQVINSESELYTLKPVLINQNKLLIPQGSTLGIDDTYTYLFKYEFIIEKGLTLESEIENILWSNSSFTSDELNQLFNFDIRINHIKDVNIANGLFSEATNGELVEITIIVSMNNIDLLDNHAVELGNDLSFDYLVTVSKN